MSMEDILKVLVDSRQQGGSSQSAADPMSELIGGLLNTQTPQSSGGQPSGLGDMMGILESVMNTQGSPNLAPANDPIMSLLNPFIAPLAKKANISPEIAMIIVSFVVHKLLAHHPTSGRDSNSFNLDQMLGQLNSGTVDSGLLQSSGMVRELSKKTGLDEQTTEKSLQLALGLVGKTISKMSDTGSKPKASKGKSLGSGEFGKTAKKKS